MKISNDRGSVQLEEVDVAPFLAPFKGAAENLDCCW